MSGGSSDSTIARALSPNGLPLETPVAESFACGFFFFFQSKARPPLVTPRPRRFFGLGGLLQLGIFLWFSSSHVLGQADGGAPHPQGRGGMWC